MHVYGKAPGAGAAEVGSLLGACSGIRGRKGGAPSAVRGCSELQRAAYPQSAGVAERRGCHLAGMQESALKGLRQQQSHRSPLPAGCCAAAWACPPASLPHDTYPWPSLPQNADQSQPAGVLINAEGNVFFYAGPALGVLEHAVADVIPPFTPDKHGDGLGLRNAQVEAGRRGACLNAEPVVVRRRSGGVWRGQQ